MQILVFLKDLVRPIAVRVLQRLVVFLLSFLIDVDADREFLAAFVTFDEKRDRILKIKTTYR